MFSELPSGFGDSDFLLKKLGSLLGSALLIEFERRGHLIQDDCHLHYGKCRNDHYWNLDAY